MKACHRLILSAIATALVAALQGPARAAESDATLDRIVTDLKRDASARGAWVNPYLPQGTGQVVAESADRILAATLRVYTREVLDRGGWVNPWVSSSHYSVGQPLLAVKPGDGLTTVAGVAVPAQAGPRILAREANGPDTTRAAVMPDA